MSQDSVLQRLFVSHASEDKVTIARPLANALVDAGFQVWFDEFSLVLGDSLKRQIDHGLAMSDFGIVILSPAFFAKHWPQEELDGLVAVETSRSRKVILPIWHNISFEDIVKYSPTLAGKLAIKSSEGVSAIVQSIVRSLNRSSVFARRDDLDHGRIHVPRRPGYGGSNFHVAAAAAGWHDEHLDVTKLPNISWEEFGENLLAEMRRLDEEVRKRDANED
jgi:hypothetical protein